MRSNASLALCVAAMALLTASSVTAQSPTSLFFDTFDSNLGWTGSADWSIGAATASTGHTIGVGLFPDPGFDADGTTGGGIAGVFIGGNAGTALTPRQYFTSPVIPSSGPLGLAFDRWLNSDYTPFMQNGIDVFDGASWVTIWSTGGSPPTGEDRWHAHYYDVSAYSNANFQVRFWYEIGSTGVYTCPSWNIDNVDVFRAVGGSGPIARFTDDFSTNTGWTFDSPDWMIGAATASSGQEYVGPDPDTDADGNLGGGVLGVFIGGNTGTLVIPRQYVTSPVYDTAGFTGLGFSFERWLNADYLPYMQSGIDVWDANTATWVTVWATGDDETEDSAWTFQHIDASAYASNTFQVRFWYEVLSTNVFSVSSWNIDNFEIFSLVRAPGQDSRDAQLDVNGSAVSEFGNGPASGDQGIYNAYVAPGTFAVVELNGTPFAPWVLLAGDANPGASPIAPYGQIDIGTGALGGLEVLGSGFDGGLANAFFNTNGSGVGAAGYLVPPFFGGLNLTLQGIVFNPIDVIHVTNAVEVHFN